jgi:hypothetical protein
MAQSADELIAAALADRHWISGRKSETRTRCISRPPNFSAAQLRGRSEYHMRVEQEGLAHEASAGPVAAELRSGRQLKRSTSRA